MQRQVRADQLRQLRRRHRRRSRPPTTRTVVMKVKKPTPDHAAPLRLHPSRAHLEGHRREGGQDLRQRARTGRHRRVRPVHRRRAQEGPVHPPRGQQELLAAARRKIDELVFRVFQNAGLAAQALQARARSTSPTSLDANVFNCLKDTEGIKTFPATYSGFDEIAFNTGAALDDGTPIGDGHPALKDKRVAPGHRPRHRQAGAGRPGARRLRHARQQRHPAALRRTCTTTRATTSLHLRPRRGQPAARRGRLHEGPTASAGRCPTAAEPLHVPAVRPQRAPTPASRRSSSSPAGSRTSASHRSQDRVGRRAHRDHRPGQVRHVRVGLGRRARPRLPALDLHLRATGRYKDGGSIYANLSDSFYCNQEYDALYEQQTDDRSTRPSGPRSSSRCRRCSTTTRPTS